MNKKVLHSVIDEVCSRQADSIAIFEEDKTVTYSWLKRSSASLAGALMGSGAGGTGIVATYLDSSIPYVASIMAINRAGFAFLPLDVTYPESRISFMIGKALPATVITSKRLPELIDLLTRQNLAIARVIELTEDCTAVREWRLTEGRYQLEAQRVLEETTALPELTGDESNYILFTSGSTGEPKAIEGCHKSLSHFIHWEKGEFGTDTDLRVPQLAPVSFDVSLRDVFLPLISGGSLHIPDQSLKSDTRSLLCWIGRSKINLIHTVPSIFRRFIKELRDNGSLKTHTEAIRYMLLAGEPLYVKDVREWIATAGSHVTLVNLYGPSETTLAKIFHRITPATLQEDGIVPLGKPISNTAVIIVKNDRICEIGEVGEILIKTPFRSKGYLNDEPLTKVRFIQNPLHTQYEDIVYRTGDMGKYLEDRSVQFVGRNDNQVKIRGNRVEVSEIENILLGVPGISQVLVTPHRKGDDDLVLIGYYACKDPVDTHTLRMKVAQFLPTYMHPSYYVQLQVFPLTLNGKVNRSALPKPEEILYEQVPYEAPASPLEETLASVWGDILGISKVGVNNSFFSLGGHSLSAVKAIAGVYKETGAEVSLKDFFEYSTIRALAGILSERTGAQPARIEKCSSAEYYDLSAAQQRLWLINQFQPSRHAYHLRGRFLLEGKVDVAAFTSAFRALQQRHETLRTTFTIIDGVPKQKVHADGDASAMSYVDLRLTSNNESLAESIVHEEAATPCDLQTGPLFRIKLVQLGDERFVLVYVIHHIISDAWSLDVLTTELFSLYRDQTENPAGSLPPLPVQYRDYAAWQANIQRTDWMKRQRDFWSQTLDQKIEPLNLPFDFERPALKDFRGNTIGISVDEELTEEIRKRAKENSVTLFVYLLGTFNVLLWRYTSQENIIIGCPVSGRNNNDLHHLIGMFVNMVPIQSSPSPATRFSDYLKELKVKVVDAMSNSDFQFDELVRLLKIKTDFSRNPVFDVVFLLQHHNDTISTAPGHLKVTPYGSGYPSSHFDLMLSAYENRTSVDLALNYATQLFKEDTVRDFLADYLSVLRSVSYDSTVHLRDIQLSHNMVTLNADLQEELKGDFNFN